MEHQESSVEIFEKFTWKIAHFSPNNYNYSEPFVLGGSPWRIVLYQDGSRKDGNLALYLEAVQMQIVDVFERRPYRVPEEWSRDVKFRLVVFNQLDTNRTITREYTKEFRCHKYNARHGCNSFMPLDELCDPEKGFIVNNVLIVGAEVFVGKTTHKNRLSQVASLTGLTNLEVPSPKPEVKDTNDKACKDLKVLWEELEKLKKNVVAQELEIKRLKTKPEVKDIKGKACEDLQVLWEELEKYRSDLTWLEPHVQSALRIKDYVEKALYVEKLKVDQELETKRLKTTLVAAEQNLNMESDLSKAKGI